MNVYIRRPQPCAGSRRFRPALLMLGSAILCLGSALAASADDRDKTPRLPLRYALHSKEPFQAVHIPIHLDGGDIIFQATLAGKTMECDLDTGTNHPTWAGTLGLRGRTTGKGGVGIDGAGKKTTGQMVILPAVRIGAYELHEVAGFAVTAGTGKGMDYLRHTVLIGTSVFAPVVLTIDYQKPELILRRPDYNFTRLPRGEHDLVFDLAPKPLRETGVLVLQGKMGKQSVRIALDTGWNGSDIGLTAAFRDKIKATLAEDNPDAKTETVRRTMIGGEAEMERLSQVAFSLGDKQPVLFKRPALILPGIAADVDAIVGPDILQYFRVTIDYARRKALLEPYLPNYADYVNPDPSRNELIFRGVSYWIPDGVVIDTKKDGSISIKSPKPLAGPKPP